MKQSITDRTVEAVRKYGLGIPFGIWELYEDVRESNCVSVVMNKLRKAGKVMKLGRGVFYRPQRDGDGHLIPVRREDIIEYVSRTYNGYESVPVSSDTVTIATPAPQKRLKLGGMTFVFRKGVYGYSQACNDHAGLVLLDRMTVTDLEEDEKMVLKGKLSRMSDKTVAELVRLSLSYPLRTKEMLYRLLSPESPYIRELKVYLPRIPSEWT